MTPDAPRTDAAVTQHRIRVGLPPDAAFSLFSDGMSEWWPLDEGFTYGGDRYSEIHLEPRVGGRFYERFRDSVEFDVGRVIACEPPHRIVFTWRDPHWSDDTEVEVTFEPDGDGAILTLTHRGFERLGRGWEEIWDRWNRGWPSVVGAFAGHVR